jgi:hypothetical protein
MSIQQTMADGFGADEIMLDVSAPQILGSLDAQLPSNSGANQGLGWQQINIPPIVRLRVVAAAKFESKDLRQPTGQGAIGFDFMLWRTGTHRMGDYEFLAVCWGHASPFSCRDMNVADGVQGSGQPFPEKKGLEISLLQNE